MNQIRATVLCCFLTVLTLQAQHKITGIITDSSDNKPVVDVYVILMNEEGKNILAYSFSDENGSYTINLPENEKKPFSIVTSRLGYEIFRQKIPLSTHRLDIQLKGTSIPLKEVTVHSPPMKQRGDTIDYYMSGFVRPQDKTLADVLARMPGINVQPDGRIQYEGKPINRFYIENMNLLDQQYSVATKNLSPDDIASVQIYENHEPIKMLRDRSNSEQAALNVRLKENKRAKWLNSIDLGAGGLPFLYSATGTLARFARRNQSMIVVKTNNTGENIFDELKIHSLKPGEVFQPGIPDGIPDQLLPLSVASSPYTRDKARFNESAIASLNQLWRVAEDTDSRLNINWGFDREKRERTSETRYVIENLPDIVIGNSAAQTIDWHKLETTFAFTANRFSFFLEEKLNANIHWKEAFAEITSNSRQVRQNMKLPRVELNNSTSFKKMINRWSLGIENNTEFTRLPQSLTLSSPDDLPLFTAQEVKQTVNSNYGCSNTYITLNYKKRHNIFDFKVGAEWVWQNLNSELHPNPDINQRFENVLSWRTSHFYAEPSHKLSYRSVTIKTSASANYLQISQNGTSENHYYINPRINVAYEPLASLKFTAGYSHNIRHGNLNRIQTGYILKRYDLFMKGFEELQRNAVHNIRWSVVYKNMPLFLNLSYIGTVSENMSNLVPASHIEDIYRFSWLERKNNSSKFWINTLSATKMFLPASLTARLSVSYSGNNSVAQQQGAQVDYTNHSFGISPSLKWNAKKNLNFDYTLNATSSGVRTTKRDVNKSIPLVNHQIFIFWELIKDLSLLTNVQHLHTESPHSSVSNLLFADLGLQYRHDKVTVNIDWTNIFDQKRYVTSNYSTVNTFTRIDKLRPSEVMLRFRLKL